MRPMPKLMISDPNQACLVDHEVVVRRPDGRFNIALSRTGRVVVTGTVPHERMRWHREALRDARRAVKGVPGKIPVIVTGTEPQVNKPWYLWMLEAAEAALNNRGSSRILAYIRR